jgi:hypothetical protein
VAERDAALVQAVTAVLPFHRPARG